MRKLLLLLCLPIALHAGAFSRVPRKLRQAVQAIEALPEAQPLLRLVEADGKVQLVTGRGAFEGQWEGGSSRRITVVNTRTLSSIIGTIIFELHNAASDRMLQELIYRAARGELNREGYVEAVERLEYRSAQKTSELIEQGIDRGLFPYETRMHLFSNFEEHYRYQQWAGHSGWIAAHYDWMFAG